MNGDSRFYGNLYRGGYVAYGVLLVLAIVFYKERTIFLDVAYHLFHILSSGGFTFQVHRYSAAFTQIFPLLASRLALPLPAVMMIYSVGVMLYYIACYWLCGSALKNHRAALALLISQLLLLTDSFYWMQNELQQGLGFMFILFAWLDSPRKAKNSPADTIVLVILVVIAGFFHPLAVVPLCLGILFFLIRSNSTNRRPLLLAAVVTVVLYFLKAQFLVNRYDQAQLKGLDNFTTLFPDYFNLISNSRFAAHWPDKYYWIPVLFVLTGATYIYRKKWLPLLLFTASVIGFVLLINVTYPNGYEADFYMENLYLPLGVIIALPLVYDVFPLLQTKRLAVILIVLILTTGVGRIYFAHQARTARLSWERNFLEKNFDKKLLVFNHEVPMDTLIMTWGTPYEFWLLSTSEYGKSASIVIDEHVDNLLWCKWENKEFITILEKFEYQNLPTKYFRFTDTVTHYDLRGQYEEGAE